MTKQKETWTFTGPDGSIRLRIKWWIEGCKLTMQVKEMDEAFRSTGKWVIYNNICSTRHSQVTNDTIYLRGLECDLDLLKTTFNFYSAKALKKYLRKIKKALTDWAVNWEGWPENSPEKKAQRYIETLEEISEGMNKIKPMIDLHFPTYEQVKEAGDKVLEFDPEQPKPTLPDFWVESDCPLVCEMVQRVCFGYGYEWRSGHSDIRFQRNIGLNQIGIGYNYPIHISCPQKRSLEWLLERATKDGITPDMTPMDGSLLVPLKEGGEK